MKKDWTDDYLNNFNNMNSKEKILEEFDKKLLKVCDVYEKAADNNSEKLENWEKEREEIKKFIYDLIDKKREETIREFEGELPNEMIFNEETDSEESKTWIAGFNNCRNQIKQSLINLHK